MEKKSIWCPSDLTFIKVLKAMKRRKRMSIKEISNVSRITQPTVYNTVRNLYLVGIVDRHKEFGGHMEYTLKPIYSWD